MDPKDVKLSKLLSWLLRHGAASNGLIFDIGGFVSVGEILKLKKFSHFNESDIKRVVETNDKKRFSIRYRSCDNILQVRANQGHTLPVDESGLLTLLSQYNLPSPVYHGTYLCNLLSIKTEGLKRMQRNHIHFSPKFPGESGVLSGIRKNCQLVIVVNSAKALIDGFKFYKSDNDVILCQGNEHGLLPSIYIEQIWQISPLQRLT